MFKRFIETILNSGKDGYNLGLHYFDTYYPNYEPHETEEPEEIALLEIVIERRKQAAHLIELELERTTDNKKRVALITKLNTMDKQTYNDIKKLNKLKDDL
jgi:hypothetical protein